MKSNNEIWKDIRGYEGLYQISNLGKVKSLERFTDDGHHIMPKILSQSFAKGYLKVGLSKKGKCKTIYVHKLVAEAFIPNVYNLPEINHKDENKENNRVDNLEWCSYSYNNKEAIKNGANTMSGFNRYNKNKYKNKYGKLYQYDKNMKLLNIYNDLEEAYIKTNVCKRNILQVINHQEGRKQAGGFIWLSEREVVNNDL